MVAREQVKKGRTATVVIKVETRDKLKTYAKHLDNTFDSILQDLMQFWDNNH